MNVVNKGIIYFLIIMGIIGTFIIFNTIHFQLTYFIQRMNYHDSIPVQGNKNHYVPQGLAYSEKYNVVLQTSYHAKHKVSMLYVTDFSTGRILHALKIKELDQSDNLHHVGGIATDSNTVWITSDYEVNEYSLEEIMNTKRDFIQSKKNRKLKIRGDFCTYYNHRLWIGDFFLNPFYPVKDDNPLLLGYDFDDIIHYDSPSIILSLPKMVQGLTFNSKGEFVFTTSFTSLISSQFLIYEDITKKEESGYYEFNHRNIPYYIFSSDNLKVQRSLPPMAEGLFYKNSSYFILFENSSSHYFYAFPKIRNVIQFH